MLRTRLVYLPSFRPSRLPSLGFLSLPVCRPMATAVSGQDGMKADGHGGEVVICGGGIIGCSIAYFLAKKGVKCTVIERTAVACAASGRAGGFLALDWSDHSPLGALSRRSFQLHSELAHELREDCEYRRVDTISLATTSTDQTSPKPGVRKLIPTWIKPEMVSKASVMGSKETTAQVHPEKFTKAVMEEALRMGSHLKTATVQDLVVETVHNSAGRKVTGVKLADGEVVPAKSVVIAMGPWSSLFSKAFNFPPISGQKYHSIIMEASVSGDALFLEHKIARGKMTSPEIYPRPNGRVYMCGEEDAVTPLPEEPADVRPVPAAGTALKAIASSLSDELKNAKVIVEQACYLPISPDGLPVIGKVPNTEGLYVATGHSCWGILNAPATGEAMAELLTEGKSKLDLSAFDPKRFVSS